MTKEQIEKKASEFASFLVAEDQFQQPLIDLLTTAMYWALSHQWVSVEDELPKDKQNVFITLASGRSTCGWYSHTIEEWFISVGEIGGDDCLYEHVTHWMQIPLLAEEGGEK